MRMGGGWNSLEMEIVNYRRDLCTDIIEPSCSITRQFLAATRRH
jgi:hypothetical protein